MTRTARYIPCEEEDIGDPDVVFAHFQVGDDMRQGCGDDGVFQSAEEAHDGAGDEDDPEAGRGLEAGDAIVGLVVVATATASAVAVAVGVVVVGVVPRDPGHVRGVGLRRRCSDSGGPVLVWVGHGR